ncbi:ribulose-phosphate 3-epimerase [Corynebacterium sp. TAE3-ERU12]|uniref:ribulose-phosphate 3-epimerase n=1 Tax=Corynebacterium sp. TAE3-ERU12 TaxID=2849491 RepID=UPI001C46EC3C|nr:ribulose-phosphate 3-epimerase [Corynebacterium sp. TAE3-ERU12]MBV7295398.1 ribulose-phosphate 3-epimerase [Corynebacterium sp. TAE3-ERU12]
MSAPIIAPSILSADFARLDREIAAISHADRIHVDVMDGHFVPNLTFGAPVLAAIDKVTDAHMDVHLMIEAPEKWVDQYIDAGADTVIFHVEAAEDSVQLARHIRSRGVNAAFSLRPGTPLEPWLSVLDEFDQVLVMSVEPGFGGQSFMPDQLDKVRTLRQEIDQRGLATLIEIDGGINATTIAQAAAAGCDCFVAGSAVYGAEVPNDAIDELRRVAVENG